MSKTNLIKLGFLAAGLAVAGAQSINPTDGGGRPQGLSQATSGVMQPLVPETASGTDAGLSVINAITQPSGPLADPNLNDMPSLNEDGVAILTTGEEAAGNWWRLVPMFSAGVVYDDNIFISNTDRKGDAIFNISGGFALEIGDYRTLEENYLLLEYLASGYFFSKYTSQNSFGQNASLLAQYRFNQLAVQLESQYQYINGAQRQVGGFTTRNLVYNDLRFIYDVSEKTSFDLELSQDSNIYNSPYNSSYYFQATAGMDYLILPKVRIGLEGTAGYTTAENNPDQTYQIINARAKYDLTGKVAIKATGGVQFNQYVTGGEAMRVSPVFSLGAEYLPFPNTTISLLGYRNLFVSPSLDNQDYWATGVELGITQTIAQKFQVGVAGGYENDTYVSNLPGVDADRVDNFFFIQPQISYNFLRYLTATVFYEHRFNDSTLQVDTWYDNQVGFEISASF
ncbi:MAG: hypothetical protein ACO39C_06495 [Chthoniobacterales bacterium]